MGAVNGSYLGGDFLQRLRVGILQLLKLQPRASAAQAGKKNGGNHLQQQRHQCLLPVQISFSLHHKSTQQLGHKSTQQLGHKSTQQLGHKSTQQLGHKSTQQLGHKSTQQLGRETIACDLDQLYRGGNELQRVDAQCLQPQHESTTEAQACMRRLTSSPVTILLRMTPARWHTLRCASAVNRASFMSSRMLFQSCGEQLAAATTAGS
jgi:hypothetical protein